MGEPTPFSAIYNKFFGKITDDMYAQPDGSGLGEWTRADTEADVKNILLEALPGFEFPRFPIYDYDEDLEEFNSTLTPEEMEILASIMVGIWVQRQVTSIENTRMKYSGNDYKFTSQANHLAKLVELKKDIERQTHHKQRLYKRRKIIDEEGTIRSNWSILRKSVFDR